MTYHDEADSSYEGNTGVEDVNRNHLVTRANNEI